MSAPVAFGVAGWSYPDWRGVVYPRGCKDGLRFVSRYVDFIEINTTFYRVPRPSVVASWDDRTRDLDVFFTAKLPQDVTHNDRLDPAMRRAFADAIAPLHDAGRLRALLAQFSYRFEPGAAAFAQLNRIAQAFGELAPLMLEVRHAGWRDPEAWRRAIDLGFSIAWLDYPGAFDGREVPVTGLGYYRLHGRNRDAWFSKDAGRDEVYDWEYPAAERLELVERIRDLVADGSTSRGMVAANNHFRGKAVKLALELRAALRHERVEVPDPLVAAYPELGEIARGLLF